MPELPEVETVRRDLAEHLVGRTIESVSVHREDILLGTAGCRLVRSLSGLVVSGVDRRGKNLIIRAGARVALLVNLGMTGQLFICAPQAEPADHRHLVAELSGGARLVFRDVRRFGHIELITDGHLEESRTLRNVGVDAMSGEFSVDYLAQMLSGRSALLKGALLDQSRLAGLGNIYVCEALFRAGIDPHVRCEELGAGRVRRLHGAIREVLEEAIAAEGTTISDYVTGRRVPGSFQERLAVYGREGEVCRRSGCGRTIARIVQSNRSTFYCPGCQRGADANGSDIS
ncbi:MAG: bifunctional DNA-formamidopyrimidine glycosylase/DNA-(apurinic or apyrimidinic site) lyase [Armatimonadota bacterium]|jgi:formamidopyrimidine-DNA glycosylase